MKVFGAGFGRTGTMSLKFALEKLGIGPCYHMREVVSRPSHIKLWYDISRGEEYPNWNRLFSDFHQKQRRGAHRSRIAQRPTSRNQVRIGLLISSMLKRISERRAPSTLF